MYRFLAPFLAAAIAAPALSQQPPELSLEQKMLLRCSAVFAIVGGEQARGQAKQYPPLAERGREYFVRAGARLMDELKLDRPALDALVRGEVSDLQKHSAQAGDPAKFVDSLMRPCLAALDASGI